MNIRSILPTRGHSAVERAAPFEELQKEIDRVFESFSRGFPRFDPMRGGEGRFVPDIEIEENDKTIRIAAELPGVDEKDVEVSLTDNILTIAGEKRSEKEHKDGGAYRSERAYGSFSRSMSLPFELDEDAVQADFRKGVLTVTVKKPDNVQTKTRKISVKAG